MQYALVLLLFSSLAPIIVAGQRGRPATAWTPQEKAAFVLLYEKSERSYEKFSLLARQQRGLRSNQLPHRNTIPYWVETLELTGCVERNNSARNAPVRTEENKERVSTLFRTFPHASIRVAEATLGISKSELQRILRHDLKFHPYKLQTPHALEPEDNATRLEFCLDQLASIEDNPNFLNNLFFSDESIFTTTGFVNRHNFRYWSPQNPHWAEPQPMHPDKVHVWAGIGQRGVIGPYFFSQSVKATNYRGN